MSVSWKHVSLETPQNRVRMTWGLANFPPTPPPAGDLLKAVFRFPLPGLYLILSGIAFRSTFGHRVDARELPELLAKMEDYNGDAITRLAMKLMAYTFVRTSEEIEAPWTEFDLDEARWTIPAERMKMNTPHIVPLSRQAVDVLKALKLLTGRGKFVFPGALDKNKPISNNTILYALYRLGYRDRMTGHGFRGLASTILNEQGFEEAHIELQLAHTKRNKVAAAYNHAKYLSQRTAMMQWWADYLDAQLAKGRKALAA